MSLFKPFLRSFSPQSDLVVSEREIVVARRKFFTLFDDRAVVVKGFRFYAYVASIFFNTTVAILHRYLQSKLAQEPLSYEFCVSCGDADTNQFFPIKITLFRKGGGN